MLDKQIQIYSVDTGNFYSNREAYLHWKNHKLRAEGRWLKNNLKDLEVKLQKMGVAKKDIESIQLGKMVCSNDVREVINQYTERQSQASIKREAIKSTKELLLQLMANKVAANERSGGTHHTRVLNENKVSVKNEISVFDSALTRMINAHPDVLSEDFMVVQVYYFDILQDLICQGGYLYKGEKYRYFTSSAGQIRTKKAVFIKESVWNQYERTIMCGLTLDEINRRGGNNPNKHLAYMALTNSATDHWDNFDISKVIVIEDFETDVFGTYDLVSDEDFSITRTSGNVPITHTDGAGMILPNAFGQAQCNKMLRMPWIKGLLGVFDFKRFIEEHGCSPMIDDIYGVKHDVILEDIQVILCKSQFKMWKYYDSWTQYQEYYHQYGCAAGFTNPEEDRIRNTSINYQMLQTLTDITDDEIRLIAKPSIDKLENMTASIENVLDAFGVTPYNTNKTAFQKSLELYPDLLNDSYCKYYLREIKDSMVKRFKAGKLKVRGKYTFLMPDFYAACQHWFCGIENPEGLLADGEVFCWLFRLDDKLDCLRSPHLFKEHAIRRNVAFRDYGERQELVRQWFTTDAIYTSCHDLLSKILQFDVDGDKSLVVADKTIIDVAERNMQGIVPLYYNMKKAGSRPLDNKTIYDGLIAAFTGGNIGQYSNNISKIWNSDVFISGSEEEKQRATDIVRLLCMQNNFTIDYAKTLYKPQCPRKIEKEIQAYTKSKVPHFFMYAKDKDEGQVAPINNSFVNKLERVIPNPRINCRKLGLKKIDHTLMMSNPDIEFKVKFTDRGKLIKEETDPVIVTYQELVKQYGLALRDTTSQSDYVKPDMMTNSQSKQSLMYETIVKEMLCALDMCGRTRQEIADILVKYLYGIRDDKHKIPLWACYGDLIYENLRCNVKPKTKEVQCVDCGEWFFANMRNNNSCRCDQCRYEHRKQQVSINVKTFRNKSENNNVIKSN